jgi:hypothetical protein
MTGIVSYTEAVACLRAVRKGPPAGVWPGSEGRTALASEELRLLYGGQFNIKRYGDGRPASAHRPPGRHLQWGRAGNGGDRLPGWGSPVWPESHLTYMIDIALTTEFSLTAGGLR